MLVRRVSTALAIVAVLVVYLFFATSGTWHFERVTWYRSYTLLGEGYYASLAEGFLRGHVRMAHEPEPRLKQLANPYDYNAREGAHAESLWDASYFRGHYYLYFSALPVLFFYLPFRLIARGYPPDALAALFFSTWAFLVGVAFLRRVLAERSLQIPFPLWVLFIGLGNVVPFTLIYVRVYEVAAIAGMAMSVTWAYALLRFIEVPSPMKGFWLGCWLALAMATRPNLGVLLFVTAVAMLRAKKWRSIIVAACLPLIVVGAALASYNVARFHKPFELGHSYQMTFMDMRSAHTCRLRNFAEVLRLFNSAIHYIFWPMNIHSHFPFVDVQLTRLDPALSWNGGADTIIGAGVLIPLTLIGTAAAILLALRREPLENGTRGALFVMGGAWLTLFGLCACWWIVTRYALDFMLLMSIATVICVERGLEVLSQSGLRILPLRVLVALLASWSIILGILLGFLGPNHEFEHANPTLFQEFAQIFNPKAPR